jgi:hypothetical protein
VIPQPKYISDEFIDLFAESSDINFSSSSLRTEMKIAGRVSARPVGYWLPIYIRRLEDRIQQLMRPPNSEAPTLITLLSGYKHAGTLELKPESSGQDSAGQAHGASGGFVDIG